MYPSVGVYGLLFFRSLGSLFVLVPHVLWKHHKERAKHNLILSWVPLNRWMWSIAIGHILIVSALVQICLKTFTVSLVSIFLNTGPILTVFLCAILIKTEHVTAGIVFRSIAAFIGVLFITLGAPDTDTVSENKVQIFWYHYVCLVLMPVLIAFGNLAMGGLRSLDPILMPFYSNIFILVIGLFVCTFSEKGYLPSDHDFEV